jgi:hypothetical protein
LTSKASTFYDEMSWKDATPKVITDVKDQGKCASSYAQVVTSALEAAYAIDYKSDAFQLSAQ